MTHNVANKKDLRQHVLFIINEKIKRIDNFADFTLEASREVKKTSKYDSIREEMQNEIFELDRQLFHLKDMELSMSKVLYSKSEKVQLGTLVITNKARFYISVSLGEFFFEGLRFYAISPESPLAKKMWGMSKGDGFVLNKIHQQIIEIM